MPGLFRPHDGKHPRERRCAARWQRGGTLNQTQSYSFQRLRKKQNVGPRLCVIFWLLARIYSDTEQYKWTAFISRGKDVLTIFRAVL